MAFGSPTADAVISARILVNGESCICLLTVADLVGKVLVVTAPVLTSGSLYGKIKKPLVNAGVKTYVNYPNCE